METLLNLLSPLITFDFRRSNLKGVETLRIKSGLVELKMKRVHEIYDLFAFHMYYDYRIFVTEKYQDVFKTE